MAKRGPKPKPAKKPVKKRDYALEREMALIRKGFASGAKEPKGETEYRRYVERINNSLDKLPSEERPDTPIPEKLRNRQDPNHAGWTASHPPGNPFLFVAIMERLKPETQAMIRLSKAYMNLVCEAVCWPRRVTVRREEPADLEVKEARKSAGDEEVLSD